MWKTVCFYCFFQVLSPETTCSTVTSSLRSETSDNPLDASTMSKSSSFWIVHGTDPPNFCPFKGAPTCLRQVLGVSIMRAATRSGSWLHFSASAARAHLNTKLLFTIVGNFSAQSFWTFLRTFLLSSFFLLKKALSSALVAPAGLGSDNSWIIDSFSAFNSW